MSIALILVFLSLKIACIYLMKYVKTRKLCCFNFSLKAGPHFSFLSYFFFSLNNANKKIYANVPEMFNFNPKTSIQKCPICNSWYNFFIANVSDFTLILLTKITKFELSYLHKKLSYTNIFK
jgi:hypothetical protein